MSLSSYISKPMNDIGPETFNNVPTLLFKNNTDLKLLADRVEQQILLSELPKFEQNVPHNVIIKTAIENLKDSHEILNEAVTTMSHILTGSFDLLKNSITPEVSSICDEIVGLANDSLSIPVTDEGTNLNLQTVCDVVDLKDYAERLQGIDTITKVLHSHAGITEMSPSTKYFEYIQSKLPEPVLDSEDFIAARQEYISAVIKLMQDDSRISHVRIPSYDELIGVFANMCRIHKIIINIHDSGYISTMVDLLESALPYMNYFKNALADMPTRVCGYFEKVVTRTFWYINFFAYVLYCADTQTPIGKNLVFRDSAFGQRIVVNRSAYDGYTAQGGTLEDIQNLLRVYYNPNKNDFVNKFYKTQMTQSIPNIGLSCEYVLSKKSDVDEQLAKSKMAFQLQQHTLLKNAILSAVPIVLAKYMNNFTSAFSHYSSLEAMRNHAMRVLIPVCISQIKADSDTAIDTPIYNFIFALRYPNHIVKVVYERLGKKYNDLIRENNDPNNYNILFADLTVMADIVTEFIVNDFCTVPK